MNSLLRLGIAALAVVVWSSACAGGGGSASGGGSGTSGGGTASSGGASGGGSGGSSGGGTASSSGGGTGATGGGSGGSAGGGTGSSGGGMASGLDGGFAAFDLDGGRISGHYVTPYFDSMNSPTTFRARYSGTETTSTGVLSHNLGLQFPAALGTYKCDGGVEVYMQLQEGWIASTVDAGPDTLGQWDVNNKEFTTCTITLTDFNAVDGGLVRGTFSAVMSPASGLPKPDAGVRLSNGTFESRYFTQ
ncbi:MAG: hypothetical protein K1X89_18830 [Myxococcaceae bacterium]|nr:hypothetical protein [Myxococcaceae bacterium]